MLSNVVLITLGLAVLSGPSAFLLLWVTYRKTGDPSLRPLSFFVLGLFLIFLGNTAAFIREVFRLYGDSRIDFLILNEAFLASVLTGASNLLFAHRCTGTPVIPFRKNFFWTITIAFLFLIVSLPVYLGGLSEESFRSGYQAVSVYGLTWQIYSTVLILKKRSKLYDPYRAFLPAVTLALMILGVVSFANDVFQFGHRSGGPNVPFSPFFFIAVNVSIAAVCVKVLLDPAYDRKPHGSPIDSGLTEREREIFPLLVEGLSNDEIAEKLFISPHTVKNHVTNIYRKAGVANRFELLKRKGERPS